MKYLTKHIASAASIIASYNGSIPLSSYLKQHFAVNKKYGSKDRKQIAHFCFLYYRIVNAVKGLSIEETITIALFICEVHLEPYASLFKAEWLANWQDTQAERINFIQSVFPNFNVATIFPWVNELSEGMDTLAFCTSHLTQPDLFLRIRPNQATIVIKKLQAANIVFTTLNNNCLAMPNNSKIDDVVSIDREVVVQDYSSQCIIEFLSIILSDSNYQPATFSIWDCCAASGGKSILVVDVLGKVKLTVSDIRAGIIQNLKTRLAKAGIAINHTIIADLTKINSIIGNQQPATGNNYQLIICDAPCTGSGTWGRTPEQLTFFKQKDILKYVHLQQQIVTNTIKYLAVNGYYLYITCSVFKQENEAMVAFILQQQPSLTLLKSDLLIGYDKKADSMFAALFKA
ncbi:MAG: Fmu (Sun) domain-containing protein [Deinococcales bacterium]|nr:Fmu (Sun) domain-containing protein [Chitinophagaceae bacterium]